MKTWFTSDDHFGHERIIELCDRPFKSVEEMNEQLVVNINATVPATDRLVFLGDTFMGDYSRSVQLMSWVAAAELVFLPGNHDKWSRAYKASAAKKLEKISELLEVRPGIKVLQEDEDWEALNSWPFCVLSDEWEGNLLDNAVFAHYPYEGESWDGREDRYKEIRPVTGAGPVVCGHVHTSWAERGAQFNAGVDVRDYKPVSELEIATWMETL